ncbi:MAG: hypothetical protein QXP65_02425 [Candidatus Hadarchaeales archaeon]
MSGEPIYLPPEAERAEAPKRFAGMVLGVVLCIVGALIIHLGVASAMEVENLAPSMGLLAAGALLIFVGAARVWPGRLLTNAGFFCAGILCLVASGSLIAGNVREAAQAILLTLVGIVLVVVGVEVAKESWKKFTAR